MTLTLKQVGPLAAEAREQREAILAKLDALVASVARVEGRFGERSWMEERGPEVNAELADENERLETALADARASVERLTEQVRIADDLAERSRVAAAISFNLAQDHAKARGEAEALVERLTRERDEAIEDEASVAATLAAVMAEKAALVTELAKLKTWVADETRVALRQHGRLMAAESALTTEKAAHEETKKLLNQAAERYAEERAAKEAAERKLETSLPIPECGEMMRKVEATYQRVVARQRALMERAANDVDDLHSYLGAAGQDAKDEYLGPRLRAVVAALRSELATPHGEAERKGADRGLAPGRIEELAAGLAKELCALSEPISEEAAASHLRFVLRGMLREAGVEVGAPTIRAELERGATPPTGGNENE